MLRLGGLLGDLRSLPVVGTAHSGLTQLTKVGAAGSVLALVLGRGLVILAEPSHDQSPMLVVGSCRMLTPYQPTRARASVDADSGVSAVRMVTMPASSSTPSSPVAGLVYVRPVTRPSTNAPITHPTDSGRPHRTLLPPTGPAWQSGQNPTRTRFRIRDGARPQALHGYRARCP